MAKSLTSTINSAIKGTIDLEKFNHVKADINKKYDDEAAKKVEDFKKKKADDDKKVEDDKKAKVSFDPIINAVVQSISKTKI